MAKPAEKFRFRRHERIGSEDAEHDKEFLADCFLDNGDLASLRDTKSPFSIVVGRTGVGKTALLMRLVETEEHAIALQPEDLALEYLSNTTILSHLEELGVKLDIFYRLLWRHVFIVEFIKLKYKIRTETDQQSFMDRILTRFGGDKAKKVAMDYLLKCGSEFWRGTEYRIHEVTEKLVADIKGSLGGKAKMLEASVSGGSSYTTEDRKEIVHRAQEVVNGVQIRKLSKVIEALAEDVFDDERKSYFVVIDKLDEAWVGDTLRYKLIRALIETIKSLRRIQNGKVVIALRTDLIRRVFRETRDAGFQEEKYQSLLLRITWTKKDLLAILQRRIDKLIKDRYTTKSVALADLLPKKVDDQTPEEFLVSRTMMRPRDIIQFMNCCLGRAEDRRELSARLMREAEAEYSKLRLRSVSEEWAGDYPYLNDCVEFLKRREPNFRVRELKLDAVESLICSLAVESGESKGRLAETARKQFEGDLDPARFRVRMIAAFFETGLVGLKLARGAKVAWAHESGEGVTGEWKVRQLTG